jgi:hypothetical protein
MALPPREHEQFLRFFLAIAPSALLGLRRRRVEHVTLAQDAQGESSSYAIERATPHPAQRRVVSGEVAPKGVDIHLERPRGPGEVPAVASESAGQRPGLGRAPSSRASGPDGAPRGELTHGAGSAGRP